MENTYHNPDEYWYYSQRYDDKSVKNMRGCVYGLTGVLLLALLCFLFSGCKTQYVPVETVRVETKYNTDTIIVKDTIINEKETIVREATAADSALLAKVGLQLDESKRVILLLQKELAEKSHKEIESHSDTVTVVKKVQVPYPVEKRLTKWETFKMGVGGIAIVVIVIIIVLVVFNWLFKVRQRV